jgi:arylsulfatase A-like enzyme
LASTFLRVAGLEVPGAFMGQVLSGFPGDGGRRREDIFAMYQGNQFGLYSQRMVRDARWKYVWNATAEDELYDLAGDPGELRNQARDAACAGELARLRGRLVQWMQSIGDPLLNGWTKRGLEAGLKL